MVSSSSSSQQSLSSSLVWFGVVLSGLAAYLYMAYPANPELEDVLPEAIQYMEKAMQVAVDQPEKPLRGLVVAVTGCTSGIGLALTRHLSNMGATLIGIGRSPSKLRALQDELLSKDASANFTSVVADLTDLDSVSQAAKEIVTNWDSVDVLVNNAGIHAGFGGIFRHDVTKQGYDLAFGVNYLSHFLLTEKLVPLLQKSKHPKVIQVSSTFHTAVDGSDLRPPPETGNQHHLVASQPGGSHGFVSYRTQRQYGNTKLAQILHARALQRRYEGVTAVSICPTWVATQIAAKDGSIAFSAFSRVAYPAHGYGLSSLFHAMFDLEAGKNENRDYYINTDTGRSRWLVDNMPGWAYKYMPVRDMVIQVLAFSLIGFQRLRPIRDAERSSRFSYDVELQESLFEWSRNATAAWL